MNNNPLMNWALQMIQNNPNNQNNPNAQKMIQAIQNNDQQTGEQIAQNILDAYGITRDQGVQMAMNFFGFGQRR